MIIAEKRCPEKRWKHDGDDVVSLMSTPIADICAARADRNGDIWNYSRGRLVLQRQKS